ncbi:MAG: hypothetical protein JXB14_04580, partial [Candidatus Altiarchaeota archaeon]|nr:hypothetical protein [Candidatus Altiarchaeota archaeon]
ESAEEAELNLPPHGGSPENTLLIINPTVKESQYIGNYYKNARDIPDRNVVYMNPAAANYNEFADKNLDALFGMLYNREMGDHIDYIVIAPVTPNSAEYRIPDSGYVSTGCSVDTTSIAISSAYTGAFISDVIRAGVRTPGTENGYYSLPSLRMYAFDSSVYWGGGIPTDKKDPPRRYFIGALLGYTGTYANTVDELTAMIDRSVAVDGTRPEGTFYFIATNDIRNVREYQFADAMAYIENAGGNAEKLQQSVTGSALPIGRHDVLGVMTGLASPGIINADMTLLPGSFGDHLTSYAGVLNGGGQEKLTNWIKKGASGSAGTVDEPCAYWQKFPTAPQHYYYYKGLSLGEAYMRGFGNFPFECLFYGDPLTRPFGYIPQMGVSLPPNPVDGVIIIMPSATTDNPEATGISHHELFVDGILEGVVLDGDAFTLDTTTLADGFHDIRVVSYDNSPVMTPGRWVGQLQANNRGRDVSLTVSPSSGDLSSIFSASASAPGSVEIRLLQNNRVVAASGSSPANFDISGLSLGGGPVKLVAEAEFADGTKALSQPVMVQVAYSNPPVANANTPPVAFSYSKYVLRNSSILIELPASDPDEAASYAILEGPSKGELVADAAALPVRLLRADENASGTDSVRFRAITSGGSSEGVVTIVYNRTFTELCSVNADCVDSNPCTYDLCKDGGCTNNNANLDGGVNIGLGDVIVVMGYWATTSPEGDIDSNGNVGLSDIIAIIGLWANSC